MKERQDDKYPEAEAQRRFVAAVRAALNTPPKRLKDIPLKWSGAKRGAAKKKSKNGA